VAVAKLADPLLVDIEAGDLEAPRQRYRKRKSDVAKSNHNDASAAVHVLGRSTREYGQTPVPARFATALLARSGGKVASRGTMRWKIPPRSPSLASMKLLAPAKRHLSWAGRCLRFELLSLLPERRRYGIAGGYLHRETVAFDDAAGKEDQWQREVYETARAIMLEHGLRSIHDVGCGSGYKLVHMLGDFDTTGIDLPENIGWVRELYPDRKWVGAPFEDVRLPKADLVICADVIEHVADPDALMRFIVSIAQKWVVLSTPDREIAYPRRSSHLLGPPENPTHLREWTKAEFRRYIANYLEIERHEITNREQATQMIVGRVGA
jgi:SAM-dependent methyltransferase